ncbi:MAG: Fic family protein [Candidatus Methanomethylophilaceae archaeon]
MHIFEYSAITESIPTDIAEKIAKIESLRAMDPIREGVYAKELKVAKTECRMHSAKSSCSMEWLDVEKDRILIEGYLNAMDGLEMGSMAVDLSERNLLSLHSTVMNGSTRKESRFRLRDSDADRHDIHVNAIRSVPAQNIRGCIEQMSASYVMARDVGVQPILLAPSMVLDLLNIRPFPEGNWRISRLILSRLLIDGGYGGLEISSLERRMELYSEDYYDSVAESSSGWNGNESDPYPFIRFITDMVLECYEEVAARYPLDLGKKVKKGERIARIVEWNDSPVSKTEICELLPDVSRRTADVVLAQLVDEGRVQKIGSYRDARYAPIE